VAVCLTEAQHEDDDPTIVVSELNRVFSLLDSIVELHPACYKVWGSICVALWCVAVCCGVLLNHFFSLLDSILELHSACHIYMCVYINICKYIHIYTYVLNICACI